jgi:hypothetical protein
MFQRSFVAAVTAAALLATTLLATTPGAVQANPDQQQQDRRDGQSRHELGPYSYLPLVLANARRLQIAAIVLMMQRATYLTLMSAGVDPTSASRVGLGGVPVLGGLFSKTYGPDDFTDDKDVGTVYFAGDDTLALALEGDMKLEDYKIIVFNGEHQYDLRARPQLQQIPPERLAQLGAVTVVSQLLTRTIAPEGMTLITGLKPDGNPGLEPGVPVLQDLPMLRRFFAGDVYRGGDKTLLIMVRPSIVAGDES